MEMQAHRVEINTGMLFLLCVTQILVVDRNVKCDSRHALTKQWQYRETQTNKHRLTEEKI